MTAGAKQQLIELLEGIAKELKERPVALNDEYVKRRDDSGDHAIDYESRWPRQVGALEALCEFKAAEIFAAIETFLKPQPRARGRK